MKDNKQYVYNKQLRQTGLSLIHEEEDEGSLRGTMKQDNDISNDILGDDDNLFA